VKKAPCVSPVPSGFVNGYLSLFQNLVGFEQALGKTGQKPGFSVKFQGTVQKLNFWNSLIY
jgi:hypothetical protein